MVTIKDVARRANVSIATVSRVITHKSCVSPEVSERVLDAISDLGYITDSYASGLRSKTTKTVGIIISNVKNVFYNNVLGNLEKSLRKIGYSLFTLYSAENAEEELNSFKSLIASKVSSIIFTPVTNTNHKIIKLALKRGIDVIQLFRNVYDYLDTVAIDDEYACYDATNLLLDHGAKRPMLINVKYESMPNDVVSPDRFNGFSKSLSEHGHTEYRVFDYGVISKPFEKLREEVLAYSPDAIIVSNSSFGLDVLKILKEYGQRYPQDVKLVFFDDIDWVAYLEITAVNQNLDLLNKALLERLFTRGDNSTVRYIKIPPVLSVRASSD